MAEHGTERCWTCGAPMVQLGPAIFCPRPSCGPRVHPADWQWMANDRVLPPTRRDDDRADTEHER